MNQIKQASYYLMKNGFILRLESPLEQEDIPILIKANLIDAENLAKLNQDQANYRVAIFRDEILEKKNVGFLHQAYRYRGKANYREFLYLSYGNVDNKEDDDWRNFINDMVVVAERFIGIAVVYAERRIKDNKMKLFLDDIKQNSLISMATKNWLREKKKNFANLNIK